jgi:hypothetical protein
VIVVSSAKIEMKHLVNFGESATYRMKSRGPRTDP